MYEFFISKDLIIICLIYDRSVIFKIIMLSEN